jgi:putative heme-binding domain-containing protein
VGFMRGTPPPAGCIYKLDMDGKDWQLVSSGFRNQFDAAFNSDGDLFTFDADMEWDLGAPWYRPTRVCHVVSGADWGWRNGSAKWPTHFADTLPPVVDIGPGSPTGITFGYGAKFPAKYQSALYLSDWSYGKLYALELEPRGASYTGKFEEFISASPLPLTDVMINPVDGAMYFLIGGRGVQSGLYRLSYSGMESTDRAEQLPVAKEERSLRVMLESLHNGDHAQAVEKAWPYLGHQDRFVRHAARTAIEHCDLTSWQRRALEETDPHTAITALIALTRKVPRAYHPTGADLDTPPPAYPAGDESRHPLQPAVLAALDRVNWSALSEEQLLELLRAYQLAFYRLGPPNEDARWQLMAKFDEMYPAKSRPLNSMLTEILCYLQAPFLASQAVELLENSPTQEEQIDLVRSLRFLDAGWTAETRQRFFQWFAKAQAYKGSNNFATFMSELKADALARVPAEEQVELADIVNARLPEAGAPNAGEPRPLVKEWKMDELRGLIETKLSGRDFDRGRTMFAAANCFGCHRHSGEGGSVGPDLTGLAGRFSAADILESVLDPDKVISDQYGAVVVVTKTGKVVTGRIVNHHGGNLMINTNMLDPNAIESIPRAKIETLESAMVSMMPSGLLNTLHEEELLDLMAFLLSRGNRNDPMFTP